MAAKTKTPLVFDQAKLQQMQEPLIVRVEKIRGNSRENVTPPGNGQNGTLDPSATPGTNWSREQVLNIENWILTQWTGGGCYDYGVTDAGGTTMKWRSAWDPNTYPERVPPNQRTASVYTGEQVPAGAPVQPQQQQPQPQQPQQVSQSAYGVHASMPPAAALYGPPSRPLPPYGAQPQQPQQQATWNAPGAPGTPGPTPPAAPQPQGQPQFMGYHPQTGQPMWGPTQPQPLYGYPGYPGHSGHSGYPGYPRPTQLGDFGGRPPRRDRPDRAETRRVEDFERREKEREQRQREKERDDERKRYQADIQRRDDEFRALQMSQKDAEHKAAVERLQQQSDVQIKTLQQQNDAQINTLREEMRRMGDTKRGAENEEVKRAREEQRRLERQREQDAINQRFAELQQALGKLAEKPTGEDPKIRIMEQQMHEQREQARVQLAESREQARQAEERRGREQERAQYDRNQEVLQAQIKEQEARTQHMLREATANKPDPMIEVMRENSRIAQEQARMQSDNMREIARMQTSSADRMSSMMMTPQALISMVRDSSSGTDMMMKNIIGSFSGIFDTFRGAVEQITQLTGGAPEPPAARIIEAGVQRAGELADRYLGVQREKVVSEARVEAAKAQADAQVKAAAVQAQIHVQGQQAAQDRAREAAQARAAQRVTQQTPTRKSNNGQSGAATSAGLSGAQAPAQTPPTDDGAQDPTTGQTVAAAPAPKRRTKTEVIDDGNQDPVTGQTIGKVVKIPLKKMGFTDEEWFGPALESVNRLRTGAEAFLSNLEKHQKGEQYETDDDGKPAGLDPDSAVDAILKGVNYVSVNSVTVKAFDELFKQGRFADFIDITLPNAPQPYQVHCVQILSDEVEMNVTDTPPANLIDTDPQPQA